MPCTNTLGNFCVRPVLAPPCFCRIHVKCSVTKRILLRKSPGICSEAFVIFPPAVALLYRQLDARVCWFFRSEHTILCRASNPAAERSGFAFFSHNVRVPHQRILVIGLAARIGFFLQCRRKRPEVWPVEYRAQAVGYALSLPAEIRAERALVTPQSHRQH